jgi:hypothetical protein
MEGAQDFVRRGRVRQWVTSSEPCLDRLRHAHASLDFKVHLGAQSVETHV